MQEFHNIDIKYTNHHDKRIQVTSHSVSARVHQPPTRLQLSGNLPAI